MLAGLYLCAILAGFLSPYSPVEDEFRSYFFHPPTRLHFLDENGAFHWRPYVIGTYMVNPQELFYASGTPLEILYRDPDANTNPYLLETLEQQTPILTVSTDRGKVLARVTTCGETDRDSGVFRCVAPVDALAAAASKGLSVQTLRGEKAVFEVTRRPPEPVGPGSTDVLFLQDSGGRPTRQYYPKLEKYPVQFLVEGRPYDVLWVFQSKVHLFGARAPGHVFLLGTDQSGRDIFSRILYGAQISLTIGLVGVLLTTVFGMLYGGISGYYGGRLDDAMMRFVEVLMSIPALYLILTLRTMIPDHLQDFYDRVARVGRETFAWQDSAISAVLVPLCALFIAYSVYRNNRSPSRLLFCAATLVLVVFGRQAGKTGLQLCAAVLPGSTHLTSQWTYLLIIVILSTVAWAGMSRVIRGMVLSLKEQEYVLAARALGASDLRVITRHILPNTLGYVIVRATLIVPFYILGEVALSFLGVGVQEPVPSWGNMLSAAQSLRVLQQFRWILSPGFFLFVTVLAYNFLGDGLRDALDPKKT
jgi:peptide/nickel transport system permease protein